MKTTRLVWAVLLLALVAQRTAWADGWTSWIPFVNHDKEQHAPIMKRSTTITSGKHSAPLQESSQDPSMLDRMGDGTRHFFRSTADLLTFKRETKPQPVSGRLTHHPRRKPEADEKPGWFSGWFGGKEEPPGPQTPQEFIGLPRPGF